MIYTISCSMKSISQAERLAEKIRSQGNSVHTPTVSQESRTKRSFIDEHLAKLVESDALIVGNFCAEGEAYGRVGASTFFEAGWAYALGKPVYCVAALDPASPYTEDITAIMTGYLSESIELSEEINHE